MRDTWREKFREYCEKIEGEQGSYTGIYECGYHWCCDECYCQFSKGCLDCVVTIEQILQRNGVNIDYADYDFEKWENLAKQAYKREYELKVQTKKEHYVCEVVKKKGVFVHLLQQSQNVEEYNSLMLIAFKKMAERDYVKAVEKFCLNAIEYKELKEVLL